MEEYKSEYIKKTHETLKKAAKDLKKTILYEKMNDRDKLYFIRGKIEGLGDVLLLTDYGWEPDQIEKLTTRFKYGTLDL